MSWTTATESEYLAIAGGPHLKLAPGECPFRAVLEDRAAKLGDHRPPKGRFGDPIGTEQLFYWVESQALGKRPANIMNGCVLDDEAFDEQMMAPFERERSGVFEADSLRAWWLYKLARRAGPMDDEPDAHWWADNNEENPSHTITEADVARLVQLGLVRFSGGSNQTRGRAFNEAVSTLTAREADRAIVGRYRDWNALGWWQEAESVARASLPADIPYSRLVESASAARAREMMLFSNLELLEAIQPMVERFNDDRGDLATFDEVVATFGRSKPNTRRRWRSLIRTGWIPHHFAKAVNVASRGRFYRKPDEFQAFADAGHPGWKGD